MKQLMSKEVDLGKEPVKHLLFVLAVPAITSQVVNALYNMVDRMYIGHIDGEGSMALTGVGICFPLIMIISAFAYLVGMGGAPRASIFMGKGEKEGIPFGKKTGAGPGFHLCGPPGDDRLCFFRGYGLAKRI